MKLSPNIPMYDFTVLRWLRKRESLTIQQVSEQSGVSVAVISKLERNQCTAELETLYKLVRSFGVRRRSTPGPRGSHTPYPFYSEPPAKNFLNLLPDRSTIIG